MPKRQKQVNETLARPARTTAQLGLGFAVIAVVHAFHPFTPEQYGALMGLVTVITGMVQVWLENRTGVALLRAVPPRKVPVKDDGYGFIGLIGAILLLVGVVLFLVDLLGKHSEVNVVAIIVAGVGALILAWDGGYFGRRRL